MAILTWPLTTFKAYFKKSQLFTTFDDHSKIFIFLRQIYLNISLYNGQNVLLMFACCLTAFKKKTTNRL